MLETICETMLEAYRRGWITSRDGNASVRYHDRDHFWITPSGTRKQTLQPDQFKKIGIVSGINSGMGLAQLWHRPEVLEYTAISHNLQPSGELPLHFELQKQIVGDTRVVLHLHPTYTIAALHAGYQLDKLAESFAELSRYTRVAPSTPVVQALSEQLGNSCAVQLGLAEGQLDYDIVAIPQHGVVAVDATPWRAFEHIERLEHVCKIILHSNKH